MPVVYFPINDDFDQIAANLRKKADTGELEPIEIGVDLINARDVDSDSYDRVYDYL